MDRIQRLCAIYYDFGFHRVRTSAMERDKKRATGQELIRELAALGFFRLLLPTERGGQALTLREFAHVFESLAEGALDVPFILGVGAHAIPAMLALTTYGNDRQKDQWLEKMALGESIGALCNSEPGAGTDLRLIQSTCISHDTQASLTLKKSIATNAGSAGLILASAWHQLSTGEKSLEVFLIDGARVQQSPAEFGGFHTGVTGSVRADQIPVSVEDSRLGVAGSGPKVLQLFYDLERLLIPVILVGSIRAMRKASLDFVIQQKRGPTALIDHQFIQQKILSLFDAEMTIAGLVTQSFETSRPAGSERIPKFDQALLSSLKYQAVDIGTQASITALELWGGAGYASDHFSQKFVRDLMGLKSLGGTREQHQIRIIKELVKSAQSAIATKEDSSHGVESKDKAA